MDGRADGEQDCSADGLEEEEVVALLPDCWLSDACLTERNRKTHVERPFGVEEGNADDSELNGHKPPEEVVCNLEWWPLGLPEETVRPGGENEGVPCCYGERAHEEVLVRRQMGREVEGRGKDRGGVCGVGHRYASTSTSTWEDGAMKERKTGWRAWAGSLRGQREKESKSERWKTERE